MNILLISGATWNMPFIFTTLDENQRRLPFFLATIGYDWPQEAIKRPEGYSWYQWLQCLSGRGELMVGGKRMEVEPGDGFFLLPNEEHEYRSLSGDWVTDWMGFGGFGVEEVLRTVGLEASGVYAISDLWRLEIYNASMIDSAIAHHETSLLVYETLLALKVALEPKTRNALPRHAKLGPVLQYVRVHYAEPTSIAGLSAVIGVTPQYLCKLFRQALGMRPFEYLASFRISKAKELLVAKPELSIAGIARDVGFTDSNYLCRVFKKAEGISPSAFRNLHSAPLGEYNK
jgi:AraC-like DNA-binding protein